MLKDARQGGTATEAFLCEGEATIGVWLPLALADIFTVLLCLMRPWLKEPGDLKIPSIAEIVGGWCLPMLSKSVAADEKERKALALVESVKRFKERFGK